MELCGNIAFRYCGMGHIGMYREKVCRDAQGRSTEVRRASLLRCVGARFVEVREERMRSFVEGK